MPRPPRRIYRAAACALAVTAGCAYSTPRASPPVGDAPVPAGWTIPRLNINGRAVYASGELAGLAEDLVEQLTGLLPDRPARVAFYYFTLGPDRHHIGESLAQDLATQMVRRAGTGVEVYTRRKLTQVMEELGFQGTELVDEATLVRVGKASGVDVIVSGRLVRPEGAPMALNCQTLEVATGRILGGGRVRIPLTPVTTVESVEVLDQAAPRVAREIAAALVGRARRLAVYDLSRSREPFAQGRELAEAIGTELALLENSPVTPLTRAALEQVIEEQHLELTEAFDETTRSEVARLAGADVVLTGFGEVFKDLYKINVQVVDVETARILVAVPLLMAR